MAPPSLQRKAIGPENDPLEREADRAAQQVAARHGATDSTGARTALKNADISALDGGGPARKALGQVGRPLAPDLRHDMESHFGHDFSGVRVHADPASAGAAQALHARAFTAGRHIVFGASRFAPATQEGRRLLAHELTHVVQQGRSGQAALQCDKDTEAKVAAVKSPTLDAAEENVDDVETQLYKRLDKRTGEIADAIEETKKGKLTDAKKKKLEALQKDYDRAADDVAKTPDSKFVSSGLQKDVAQSAKSLERATSKRDDTKAKWVKYDSVFASDEVVKALGTSSLTPAELKALIAKESGDLMTNPDGKGIAGIAQMGVAEEKRAGGKPGDRKIPEKAIVLAATTMALIAGDLDKQLTNKVSGVNRKKFIMAAYNGGVNMVVQAQAAAIGMGKDGTDWDDLVAGGKTSALFEGIKKTYAAGKEPGKYAEVTSYVTRIYERLVDVP